MDKNGKIPASQSDRLGRKTMWRLGLLALLAVAVAVFGVTSRDRSEADLTHWTDTQAVPTVDVVMPEHGVGPQELTLPGNVAAWYQAAIYARVNGYVKMWYKDIG